MKTPVYTALATLFLMIFASCEKSDSIPKAENTQESRSKALKAMDSAHDEAMKRDTQLEGGGPTKNMPQSIPTK